MSSLDHLLHWLLSPLSGATTHQTDPAVYWHARLMVLAWGFCLPSGVLVARYFKILPQQDWPRVLDHKAWWHAHRLLQYSGVLVMGIGVWLVFWFDKKSDFWYQVHRFAGWFVVFLAAIQMVGGIWRGSKGGPTDDQIRGDHYDMTSRRRAFERVHKGIGWLAIVCAIPVTLVGLFMVDAPRWMLVVLVAWWITLVFAAIYLQRRGVCIDTYQAIWGIDPQMPGMKCEPIGWGVQRHSRNPWV